MRGMASVQGLEQSGKMVEITEKGIFPKRGTRNKKDLFSIWLRP